MKIKWAAWFLLIFVLSTCFYVYVYEIPPRVNDADNVESSEVKYSSTELAFGQVIEDPPETSLGGILSRKLNENEIEQLLDSEGNFFERRQILELIAGRPWANNNGYGFTSDEQLDLAYLLDENLSELYRCDLRIIQAIALRNKIEETKNSNKLLYDKLDHVLEHAVHYCRNTISEVREKNINPPENTTTNFGLIISPLHWAGFGDEEFGYDSNFRALENPELEKSLIELMLKEAKNLPEGPKKENVLNQLKNRKEKI